MTAVFSQIAEAKWFHHAITFTILMAGVLVGVQTYELTNATVRSLTTTIDAFDQIILWIFVLEIVIKMGAEGSKPWRYFSDPWNVFDFTIVAITLMPAGQGVSVLRALRILRAFRLISTVPSMRKVVEALMRAIPGMISVLTLLSLVFYVSAVMATKLFGEGFPDWFGTIGESLYSLFQIMTLESWSMGIVRPVMESYPLAWLFFVPFILITTFAVLNLFIAIVVDAMSTHVDVEETQTRDVIQLDHQEIMTELRTLRAEMSKLTSAENREIQNASSDEKQSSETP